MQHNISNPPRKATSTLHTNHTTPPSTLPTSHLPSCQLFTKYSRCIPQVPCSYSCRLKKSLNMQVPRSDRDLLCHAFITRDTREGLCVTLFSAASVQEWWLSSNPYTVPIYCMAHYSTGRTVIMRYKIRCYIHIYDKLCVRESCTLYNKKSM